MNLYFEKLCKGYGGKTVFKDINGEVNSGDRIGIIGANGVGKTTLVRILSHLEDCDSGSIRYLPFDTKILYVDQYPVFDPNISAYDEVYMAASANFDRDIEMKVKKSLDKIGLNEELWGKAAANLSGGEKTKLMLGKAMVSDFDLLILDEPTNHLDMESCQVLEEFLNNLNKTMIVISHDRYFLDKVVNRIWDLTSKGLKEYIGNYSDYKIQRENEIRNITREYGKQQLRIKELKESINERKNWFSSAHNAAGQNDFYRAKAKKHSSIIKSKEKELERLEKVKVDKPEKSVSPAFDIINRNIINKKLPPFLIRVEKLIKNFGERVIFNDVNFSILRGDKAALIGENGSGKTTLLKIINGIDNDYTGDVNVNPSIEIGYFAQELNLLNNESTIIDDILTKGVKLEEARLLLACLLFKGDDVYKKIKNLSMGEKCRVAFAKLILSDANLLVLDEPTNYMDIPSKEKIEEVLNDFKGSVLFVSHDRYLIKGIANKILKIENYKVKYYDGGYEYYINAKKEEKKDNLISVDYRKLTDNIRYLECQLAFLSGKLDEAMNGDEKKRLNDEFIETARELNNYRNLMEINKK